MPKLAEYRAEREQPLKGSPGTPPAERENISILHVDMDAFFVSVELLERPDLRGLPVVVGGAANERGVVTSASYEARRFGVHSAMPLRTAGKLCPQAVFLDNRHELYTEWSDRVAAILAKYSPVVEMASIDEAYIDLTGTERCWDHRSRRASFASDITKTTGLPCSEDLRRRGWWRKWRASRPSHADWCGFRAARKRPSWRRLACGKFRALAK